MLRRLSWIGISSTLFCGTAVENAETSPNAKQRRHLIEAFTSRWLIRMRVIEVEELRVAIYHGLKPSVISQVSGSRAAARVSIWPRRIERVQPRASEWDGEALPVLVG